MLMKWNFFKSYIHWLLRWQYNFFGNISVLVILFSYGNFQLYWYASTTIVTWLTSYNIATLHWALSFHSLQSMCEVVIIMVFPHASKDSICFNFMIICCERTKRSLDRRSRDDNYNIIHLVKKSNRKVNDHNVLENVQIKNMIYLNWILCLNRSYKLLLWYISQSVA